MKAFMIWTGTYLKPVYNSDQEQLKQAKFKIGETYEIEYKRPRNYEFHKKYFALLNLVLQNQEYFNNLDSLRHYLTMKAGYVNTIITPKGTFYEPKSISFASMNQADFDDLYQRTLDVVCSELLDVSQDAINTELSEFY